MKKTTEERFWEKVDKSGSCWNWTASIYSNGYGKFSVDRNTVRAHRFSYELKHGQIPANLVIMHSCDNRLCVNPAHLSVGTQFDNVQDMIVKSRQTVGSARKDSKLTEAKILEIRAKYSSETYSQKDLADEYGVAQMTICNIVRRAVWKHI